MLKELTDPTVACSRRRRRSRAQRRPLAERHPTRRQDVQRRSRPSSRRSRRSAPPTSSFPRRKEIKQSRVSLRHSHSSRCDKSQRSRRASASRPCTVGCANKSIRNEITGISLVADGRENGTTQHEDLFNTLCSISCALANVGHALFARAVRRRHMSLSSRDGIAPLYSVPRCAKARLPA